MKTRITALLAAILALSLMPLSAEDAKADTVETSDKAKIGKAEKAKVERKTDWVPREEWDKLTDEQRAEKAKARKIASDTYLKELKDKKAAGTLSEKETKQLERLEARSGVAERRAAKGKKPAATSDKLEK